MAVTLKGYTSCRNMRPVGLNLDTEKYLSQGNLGPHRSNGGCREWRNQPTMCWARAKVHRPLHTC